MKVKGKVAELLPMRGGISQRTDKEWKSQPFILEFFDDGEQRFPDQMILDAFDTKHIETITQAHNANKEVVVIVGHKLRRTDDGRCFNEMRLYQVALPEGVSIPDAQAPTPAAPPTSTPTPTPTPEKVDKLPF